MKITDMPMEPTKLKGNIEFQGVKEKIKTFNFSEFKKYSRSQPIFKNFCRSREPCLNFRCAYMPIPRNIVTREEKSK